MRVERLYRYPVKGLSAEPLEAVTVEAGGMFPWDRAFALAQGDSGFDPAAPRFLRKSNFMCLAKNARIATLRSRFEEAATSLPGGETLTIAAPNGTSVTASPTEAEGRARIAAFLARFLDDEARGAPSFHHVPGHQFSDDAEPLLSLMSTDTLRQFEADVGAAREPLRFRSNIEFSGAAPWAEFDWLDRTLKIGSAEIRVVKRTRRCAATEVNPATALRDANPVRELMRTYRHTDLGVHATVVTGGRIAVGDAMELR